jgi:hypothetical protein
MALPEPVEISWGSVWLYLILVRSAGVMIGISLTEKVVDRSYINTASTVSNNSILFKSYKVIHGGELVQFEML